MATNGVPQLNSSLSALASLRIAERMLSRSLERLSSGQRINRAPDDPAGLAISERLRSSVREANRAAMNAMDEISMTQTADSALGEINTSLQDLRELSVYAANGVLTDDDRAAIQMQVKQSVEHIEDIAAHTTFNSQQLLTGELGIEISAKSLGISGFNVSTQELASTGIATAGDAITTVSSSRGELGSMQNRLESSVRSLSIQAENTLAAESRIRDLDYAKEITNLVNAKILADLALGALAQANVSAKAGMALL